MNEREREGGGGGGGGESIHAGVNANGLIATQNTQKAPDLIIIKPKRRLARLRMQVTSSTHFTPFSMPLDPSEAGTIVDPRRRNYIVMGVMIGIAVLVLFIMIWLGCMQYGTEDVCGFCRCCM